MDDAETESGPAPQELELDESFDEQKSQVDAWEEATNKERENRNHEQSGA